MTELNPEPNPEPNPENDAPEPEPGPGAPSVSTLPEATSAAADVAWPALPSQHVPADPSEHQTHGHQTEDHQAHVQDPAVSAVLDRLAALQQMPVSGHGEVYAGM